MKAFVTFAIDRIYCCFFVFYPIQENQYLIHRNPDLCYDIYNAMNEHNWRQTQSLSSILNYLISIFKWIKKLFYNFLFCIVNHNFYSINLWFHYTLSLIIYGGNMKFLDGGRFTEFYRILLDFMMVDVFLKFKSQIRPTNQNKQICKQSFQCWFRICWHLLPTENPHFK